MVISEEVRRLRGAEFLFRPVSPSEVFTPEEFTAEQRSYAKTARDFVKNEVMPHSERIEAKDYPLAVELFRKAGELGLLMAEVPEEQGGLELSKTTSALIYENLSGQTSFQTFCGVHSSIGSLPIAYYGTKAQKDKYLTRLATGELIGCYCLTEATAGSDALACRTRALLSEDGTHYTLNGVKQFITNGGIADLFTVFAKVDGAHFSAFIVERGFEGVSTGAEEHKLGIAGSSTTTVILEDAKVPAENLLGEVGGGHKIAFNILNFGRVKLGVQAAGYCKLALEEALAYSLERKQFGSAICEFRAIREKLSRIYVRTYALESASYRTLGHIDALSEAGLGALAGGEEFRVECALVKALGTEILDYAVDEALQVFGGYGYCAEYPLERYYRDARINRIYEGTNEINRVLAASILVKLAGERGTPPEPDGADHGTLTPSFAALAGLKRATLRLCARAAEKFGRKLGARQDVLMRLADLAMGVYFAESALLRAAKNREVKSADQRALHETSALLFCEETLSAGERTARELAAALEAGAGFDALMSDLQRDFAREPVDVMALGEEVASLLVNSQRVVF